MREIMEQINNLIKIPKQNGYAIMFTVILVSIISLISIGLSNTTYKQMILSSGAKDSQLAFFESDMAMECALYLDNATTLLEDLSPFSCGTNKNGNPYLFMIGSVISGDNISYDLNPEDSISNSLDSCFRIGIEKNSLVNFTKTTITANGYNICNKDNSRTVERTIEVRY